MDISSSRLELIRPDLFSGAEGIQAWFTLKNPGISDPNSEIPGLDLGTNTGSPEETIMENREQLYKILGLEPGWVALAGQVHGTRIRHVTTGGSYPETDGLITEIPGLALAIQVADCAAVLLGDPGRNVAAAVHAGWRGAAGGILPQAVHMMKQRGSDPFDIRAFVSPCISGKHFEVGGEVAEQFPDRFVDRKTHAKPHVDLKSFLKYQLLEVGLKELHIDLHGGCTVGEPALYYSYRREKKRSGRMMGIIKLPG